LDLNRHTKEDVSAAMNSPSDDTANKSREGELEDWGGERRRNKRSRKEQDDEEREGNDEPMALVLVKDEETAVEDEETAVEDEEIAVEDEETAVEDEEPVEDEGHHKLDAEVVANDCFTIFAGTLENLRSTAPAQSEQMWRIAHAQWCLALLQARRKTGLDKLVEIVHDGAQFRTCAENFLRTGTAGAAEEFFTAFNAHQGNTQTIRSKTQDSVVHLFNACRKLPPEDLSWDKVAKQVQVGKLSQVTRMLGNARQAKTTRLPAILDYIYPGWR